MNEELYFLYILCHLTVVIALTVITRIKVLIIEFCIVAYFMEFLDY